MAHIQRRERKDPQGRPRRVYVARYVGTDGKERSRTFARKIDAELFVATAEADKARGAWIDPAKARTPFAAWAEQWAATTHHLRPSSRARTEGILERHLLPRFGRVPLAAITTTDVRAFVSELVGAGLAAGSVQRIYAVLRSILRAAEESRLVARSPCIGVSIPSTRRVEPRFLSAEELSRVAEAAGRFCSLVLLGGYGGLRWAEMVGLKVGRIDFLRSRVRVEEAMVEVRGRFTAGPTKTGKMRMVTLPQVVTESLAAHLAAFPQAPDGLVFTDSGGGPLRHSNFRRRVWLPALEAAALAKPRPRVHDLRHTAAALAIAAGAHPKAIQERLGHASITTTLNIYGHLFPALDEDLAARLEGMARAAVSLV